MKQINLLAIWDIRKKIGKPAVIGMHVSPRKMFPARISLGMRVPPHTYH